MKVHVLLNQVSCSLLWKVARLNNVGLLENQNYYFHKSYRNKIKIKLCIKIALAFLDVFDEKFCVLFEDQEILLDYQVLCK